MHFARAGTVYALANVVSAAVPMLLLPILTRVLSPTEYGHVVGFALLVTLFSTVAGLNAHAALGVVWFKEPREQISAYSAMAIALAIGSTLIVMPFAGAAVAALPELAAGIGAMWGVAAALTAGANVIFQCRVVLWQSQQKPIPSALIQVCASVVNVTVSLVAVLVFGLGGWGRNGGIAIAACLMAITAVVLFYYSRELRWQPSRHQLAMYVAFGCPLILHGLGGLLLATADRWTISVQLGSHALGVYGAAAQLGMVMAVITDAFVKTFGPWLNARLAVASDENKQCAVGAIYAAMPVFLLAAAPVGALLYLVSAAFLGPQYRVAAGLLPWFVLGGAFTGMYVCTSVLYFFSGRTGLLSCVTLTSAVLGTAATWALVSSFGLNGAAAGYALSQALLAGTAWAVAFGTFDLPWREPYKGLAVWYQHVAGKRLA